MFKNKNIFTIVTMVLLAIMPVYVISSLFLTNIIGIPGAGFFLKEFLLVVLFGSLVWEYWKAKKLPKFDKLDYLIFAFIGYGIIITLVNGLGLKSIIYGGRYDFMFLIVMLIYKHSGTFLQATKEELIKVFLISGGISLFLAILFKFTMKEEFLVNFGFVNYQGNWTFEGGVPNYHGLEGTGMRRFQGVFDGPNQMAYFLILFSGLFLYLQKNKNQYYVWLFGGLMLLFLFLTYSRSAFLGTATAIGLLILSQAKYLFVHYKKYFIIIITCLFLVCSTSMYLFRDTLNNIIFRHGSTKGHIDRMIVGVERFTQKPLGAGLAESGPAYRAIYPEKQTKDDEYFYIPESWYIQLLTEGGVIYFSLFFAIIGILLWELYKESKVVFASFVAILVMNIFLHIFEASYLSISLFLFIGLFIKKNYNSGVTQK
ncbi:O-antigen ligase family protein [Candidatus Gracilibacteria bacterium]|nr:O-antigen ligase family protein [Candidatus Gracilibacteria bacterium]